MILSSKYDIGQTVYLHTDIDQRKRIIVQICFSAGSIQYLLSCGTHSSWHYEFEISEEVNILSKTE